MSDDHRPERIFHRLRRNRITEHDFEALWQRIETCLEPQPPGLVERLARLLGPTNQQAVLRLAGVVGVVTILGVALWFPSSDVAETAPTLALTPPAADTAVAVAWELDVRLVRGFDGAPPLDVRTEAVDGAGAASRLTDLRADLGALVQFDDFGLVGEWTGRLGAGGDNVQLASDRALTFEIVVVDEDSGALQLRNIWLDGTERFKVASEMMLTPGVPHLIGVRSGADAGPGSLFLAMGVRPSAAPESDPGASQQE